MAEQELSDEILKPPKPGKYLSEEFIEKAREVAEGGVNVLDEWMWGEMPHVEEGSDLITISGPGNVTTEVKRGLAREVAKWSNQARAEYDSSPHLQPIVKGLIRQQAKLITPALMKYSDAIKWQYNIRHDPSPRDEKISLEEARHKELALLLQGRHC